jgi:myo-inositol-1(or 4)-monophosphatase
MTPRTNSGARSRRQDLTRISNALCAATDLLRSFEPGSTAWEQKSNGDPVTAADRACNELLHTFLVRGGEGWLSEETADDRSRLTARRVWVVDPLDGTREFVEGIPEWCVSVGLVEDHCAVAGGICNPVTGEIYVGSIETGLQCCCPGVQKRSAPLVLASRSEVKRGEWSCFDSAPFTIQCMGSVAYKMARVAAGHADATWTLGPKHEWDVAAGTALVKASGGSVITLDDQELVFNRCFPLFHGLLVAGAGQSLLLEEARRLGFQLLNKCKPELREDV